jgi:hypothetical protein
MSTIGGKKREQSNLPADFTKKVGLFEAEVVAINPDAEEYKDILGMELKEDSKATEYLGKSQNGNKTLRIDFWLEEVKSKEKFKVTFFLEDAVKENKDKTKKQYINAVGMCSWADDPNNLQEWFTKREYRPAFIGEEDLYNFLRTWLGNLDLREAESTLEIEWKKLMNGNVRDIKELIGGEYATNVVALATVKSVIKDDETKEYQAVYNKAFLPSYCLKQFRLLDYSSNGEINKLRAKKSKELKPHERFVLNVTGEYGCKDYYTFKDLRDYNSDDNLVASDKVIADDDMEY